MPGSRRRLALRALALEPRRDSPCGTGTPPPPAAGWTSRSSSPGSSTTRRGIGLALVNLGWVELLEGDLEHAFSCFEEAAAIARRLGARWLGADAIWGFAHVAAARGDADRAARLAGAALAFGGPGRIRPGRRVTFTPHLDDARAALGEQAWQKAWDEGAELDLDAALRLALDR